MHLLQFSSTTLPQRPHQQWHTSLELDTYTQVHEQVTPSHSRCVWLCSGYQYSLYIWDSTVYCHQTTVYAFIITRALWGREQCAIVILSDDSCSLASLSGCTRSTSSSIFLTINFSSPCSTVSETQQETMCATPLHYSIHYTTLHRSPRISRQRLALPLRLASCWGTVDLVWQCYTIAICMHQISWQHVLYVACLIRTTDGTMHIRQW